MVLQARDCAACDSRVKIAATPSQLQRTQPFVTRAAGVAKKSVRMVLNDPFLPVANGGFRASSHVVRAYFCSRERGGRRSAIEDVLRYHQSTSAPVPTNADEVSL